MKLHEIVDIFESPQMTFPTDFKLNDDKFNVDMAREYLHDKRKKILESGENGKYTLYEFPRAFVMIDHETKESPRIVYLMRYEVKFHKFINKQTAQQITVWRDTQHYITEGLAKHVFFNYLLHNYKAIITDAQQTDDGQKFWDKRILEALKNEKFVYYVNLMPDRELVKITNDAEYRKLVRNKEIWGDKQKHQSRRIVISDTELN